MANTMRWRYGDVDPVLAPVASATVIEIGDVIYLAANLAKPANALADAGTKAGNQEALHDAFLGVALSRSRDGDTDPVRVATRGVFEFPCPAATYELGALLGVSENGPGTALVNQQLEAVAAANLSIGRVTQRAASATVVLTAIESTVMHGGVQAAM
ncbi:MAG: hypothetical protein QM811_18835 [Pirellulales bacterium]